MVAKTNSMARRMSRRSSSASAVDCTDDTSSYLFLSQKAAADASAATKAAAHVEPSKSNKNKKPKSKQMQRQQRTSTSTGKKMQKKLVALTKGISNNLGDFVSVSKNTLALPSSSEKMGPTAASGDNNKKASIRHRMASKMMKATLPGRLHHRRSPSLATATTSTDADITFVTQESSESASASGIDVSLETVPPAITEDDARSLGTSGTTATGATAQVGNLTTNTNNGVNSGVLSTILDVSVDISQDGDGTDDEDSCDNGFDEDDPIIIAGSRSVTIDYVFLEPQISPNATGRRKQYQAGTSGGGMSSPDDQDKGRGALAKSSIFVNHTTTVGAGSAHTAVAHGHTSTEAPPPISLARPVVSSSFTPKVVEVPIATTSDGNKREREQSQQQQQERTSVLERFLDRFSCGAGCDSPYSIYEM